MKIGKVNLKNNIFLAPMAGVTFNAFRLLCKDYGAGLCCAPIINENALLNNPKKVIDLLPQERPVAAQLIGKDSIKLSKAAKILEPYTDIIDLNCGCSRIKELNCGYGAALLRKPEKISKLVSKLVSAVSIPITVKLRLGFNQINILEVTKLISDAGASAVTVHARTAKQDYSAKADWFWIKKVKDSLIIPIIGNGDLFNAIDVKKMFDQTGCDAVMIGRGANGNPFIFSDSINYLETGAVPEKHLAEEKVKAFMKFLQYYHAYRDYSLPEIKDHAFWFTKGLVNSKSLRDLILRSKTEDEIKALFQKL